MNELEIIKGLQVRMSNISERVHINPMVAGEWEKDMGFIGKMMHNLSHPNIKLNDVQKQELERINNRWLELFTLSEYKGF